MKVGSFNFNWSDRSAPLTVDDYRDRARRALPRMVWAYLEHGAEGEAAMLSNKSVFGDWALRARMLTGKSPESLATEIGGVSLSMPVMLAPTGVCGLTHWAGEPACARAAEAAGVAAIISTSSSYSIEEVADATERDHFFQLYPMWNKDGVESVSSSLMRRAKRAGYAGLVVTVDVPIAGNRLNERRYGMGLPPTLSPRRVLSGALHPRWAAGFLRHQRISARNLVDAGGLTAATESLSAQLRLFNPELHWDHLAWFRDQWDGPFYVKGIMSGEDAERAVGFGADGVIISNHGGRQLADAQATLDVLPEVAAAIGAKGEVLLDGGVGSGTDVVKALCLGADAVCLGRAYLYGLAAAGQAGVEDVLRIIREEMVRTLTLMGVGSLDALGPEWLAPRHRLAEPA